LTDEGIAAAAEVFHKWESREKLSRVVTLAELREADFNLSPSLFVEINGKTTHRSLSAIVRDLIATRHEREQADRNLDAVLRDLKLTGKE
jgi:type I restriction enzyme M protein